MYHYSEVAALSELFWMMPSQPAWQGPSLVISAIGMTLLLTWGSSYYLLTVLAGPISQDTGWPLAGVVSGLSVGLLVSGLVAPLVGRSIQQWGGRPVMAAGSLLLAAGLACLAISPSLPVFLGGWILIGAGMSSGLYDAAFAVAGRLYGREARGFITILTLWGGFASTLCWPLSAWLVEVYGWRGTCLAYAALHLLVCLPLHLLAIPSVSGVDRRVLDHPAMPSEVQLNPSQRFAFGVLATMITLSAVISSMIAVHLLSVLELQGYALTTAVALGALIGPSQVGARLLEMAIGQRYHPIGAMIVAVVLVTAGLVLLLLSLPVPALALILYGAGNGLQTVARGALPLVVFNPELYAIRMGQLAMPSLIAQALAPVLGAWLLIGDGTSMLQLLTALSFGAVGLSLVLGHCCRSPP